MNRAVDSLSGINLPFVAEGCGPIPHEEPSLELQISHALFLWRIADEEKREKMFWKTNPERFQL